VMAAMRERLRVLGLYWAGLEVRWGPEWPEGMAHRQADPRLRDFTSRR